TYAADPFTSVMAVSIWPSDVASRSPWNCFDNSSRPIVEPPVPSCSGWGVVLTSNGPLVVGIRITIVGLERRARCGAGCLEDTGRRSAAARWSHRASRPRIHKVRWDHHSAQPLSANDAQVRDLDADAAPYRTIAHFRRAPPCAAYGSQHRTLVG